MQAIVRKRQRRKLEEEDKGPLAFRARGNEVGERKIERWMKEKDIPEDKLYALSPAARKALPKHYDSCALLTFSSYSVRCFVLD